MDRWSRRGPFNSRGQQGKDGMARRDAQHLAVLGVPERDGLRAQRAEAGHPAVHGADVALCRDGHEVKELHLMAAVHAAHAHAM
jgi:hypothetical protein